MAALHNSCDITLQPVAIPSSPTNLIQMLYLDRDNADSDDKGILTWYACKVLNVSACEEVISANIEWDGAYDHPKDKTGMEDSTEEGWY